MEGQTFDYHKALQAMFYLQAKASVSDKLSLLKLLFFADRYHVRHYGISMLMDNYCAMTLGPVCSKTYDIIKKGLYYDGLGEADKLFIDNNLSCVNDVVSIKDTGSDELSVSDIEALDFSIKNFAQFTPYDLSQITHAYPEWSRYKYVLENHISVSENMNYKDFFDDPEDGNEYIAKYLNGKDPFEDDKELLVAMKQEYGESL